MSAEFTPHFPFVVQSSKKASYKPRAGRLLYREEGAIFSVSILEHVLQAVLPQVHMLWDLFLIPLEHFDGHAVTKGVRWSMSHPLV